MYPSSNPYVWCRYPGSSNYVLENSVAWPRECYLPSYYYDYYNQSYQINYPQQRVTIEEVEEVNEENGDDVEADDDDEIIDVGTEEFEMDALGELKSYEEEEAIANGDLDAPLYSPISICSSLSDETKKQTMAGNLDRVRPELGGDIDADDDEVTVEFDSRISGAYVQDVQLGVGSVMEVENRVDLQAEVHDEVRTEPEPELIDNNVQTIQVEPVVRRSSRLLKKSKDGQDDALDESPKKKLTRWMTRKRCDCCSEFSKH